MFLQNQIEWKDLESFFDFEGTQFNLQSRPVEYFFYDIQRTTEADSLENLQLYLLTARKSIYQAKSSEDIDLVLKYGWDRYKQRLQKVSFFFDCCQTLTWAEKQQKALERQMQTNRQEGPSFFKKEDSTAFFEQLYEMKINHGFYSQNVPKDIWIQGCAALYDKCRLQPIPAMLLPTLLTIFSTDGKEFQNLYAYFRYKNRRFSESAQREVVALFKEICKAISTHIPDANSFVIPVFYWYGIEEAFCVLENLNGETAKTAKQYFAEYRNRNDLSKSDETELLKIPYGRNIRALAKLCNLNAYIMMNFLPDKHVPAKAKRPLRLLLDGKLLPKRPHMEKQGDFDRFFCDLYQQIPAIPSFSQLALLRYYKIPLDLCLDAEPDFFPDIEESMIAALSQYSDLIQYNYWREQAVVYSKKDNKPEWLDIRANARVQYQLGNILERNTYIKHTKEFAIYIIRAFTEDDYRQFIEQKENFHVRFFPRYLRQFCEKHHIDMYENVSDQEACFLEDEAFSTILVLVQNFLLKNIHSFWNKAVARALYT